MLNKRLKLLTLAVLMCDPNTLVSSNSYVDT